MPTSTVQIVSAPPILIVKQTVHIPPRVGPRCNNTSQIQRTRHLRPLLRLLSLPVCRVSCCVIVDAKFMADSDNESGGHNNSYAAGGDFSSPREQDRFLPIANVSRIMKKALPANAKISKDAKETVQECVSEFISFITGEASDKCQREKRKTINGDDLLWAMTTLGFEEYVEPLKVYLHKFREIEGEKGAGGAPGAPGGGGSGASGAAPQQKEAGYNGGYGGGGGGMYGGGGMMMMGQPMYGSPTSAAAAAGAYHQQMAMGGKGSGGGGGSAGMGRQGRV